MGLVEKEKFSSKFNGLDIDQLAQCQCTAPITNSAQETSPFSYDVIRQTMQTGNLEEVEKMLKQGANINIRDERGRTPVFAIVDAEGNIDSEMHNISLLRLLLKYKARVDIQDNEGMTPLLIANQAAVNLQDEAGWTPIHWIVMCAPRSENNRKFIVELLLHGADIDIQDNEGRTPLHYAALISRSRSFLQDPLIEFLTDHGASTTVLDDDGKKPLDLFKSTPDPWDF